MKLVFQKPGRHVLLASSTVQLLAGVASQIVRSRDLIVRT